MKIKAGYLAHSHIDRIYSRDKLMAPIRVGVFAPEALVGKGLPQPYPIFVIRGSKHFLLL
jgi:hypothetical protein